MNKNGAYNCGKCDKCLRTMVNLYIAGALDKAETFPKQLDLKRIATTPTIVGPDLQIFHHENLSALRASKMNPELEAAVANSIAITERMKPLNRSEKLREKIAYFDHAYLRGSLYSGRRVLAGRKYA